jgi:signal peptidase II
MAKVIHMISVLKAKSIIFWIALISVILDLVSKALVRHYSPDFNILPFLSINYIQNTGIAFGLFKGKNLLFLTTSFIILMALFYYIIYIYKVPKARFNKSHKTGKAIAVVSKENLAFDKIAFGLIIGGAIGNIIDRIFYGYVIDFISLSFWPAFNIADSCLTVGIIFFVLSLWNNGLSD